MQSLNKKQLSNEMPKAIRLTSQELASIKTLFNQNFTDQDHLWLFGARVNPAREGGDIDLYIETLESDYDTVFRRKTDFISALQSELGEQKIDVVLKVNQEDVDLPIYIVAKETGQRLV